jgi:hypothetical protein
MDVDMLVAVAFSVAVAGTRVEVRRACEGELR